MNPEAQTLFDLNSEVIRAEDNLAIERARIEQDPAYRAAKIALAEALTTYNFAANA